MDSPLLISTPVLDAPSNGKPAIGASVADETNIEVTNPATGKPLNIPQKQFVSFKPGKTLKERIAALKG